MEDEEAVDDEEQRRTMTRKGSRNGGEWREEERARNFVSAFNA